MFSYKIVYGYQVTPIWQLLLLGLVTHPEAMWLFIIQLQGTISLSAIHESSNFYQYGLFRSTECLNYCNILPKLKYLNSLVPDDVHRRHVLSSLLSLMTSQDVQNSYVFLKAHGYRARKIFSAAGINGLK